MSTLLLRLAAPMQSWGVGSKFNNRMTNREPTRSGVIGMVACAMGIRRDDSLGELEELRFGVRIDQPGELQRDFQMVHQEEGIKGNPWLTYRYYLHDAVFLAALDGSDNLLTRIEEALYHPAFPIFLGRMSCPPVGELCLGIRQMSFMEALRQEKWQAASWYQKKMRFRRPKSLEIVRDAVDGEEGYTVRDVPESFSRKHRIYNWRNVVREHLLLELICTELNRDDVISTDHNPMELLEEYDVSIENTDKS